VKKDMKKLIILLMSIMLVFFCIGLNVLAVPTYSNVGPTTNFEGDVGAASGKAYYINGTLLSLGDITTTSLITEAMLKAVDAAADEEILTYEVTTGDFEWELPDELFLAGTGLTWNGDHVTLDVDDAYLLNTGDTGTGIYDFGGATSFEIPNKNADPAATGEILLDTTVAGMTNGNPATYDGTAIRYFITLAAADIWSTDDYVVAYDADADKFYMKLDNTTAGTAGNFVEHFMDVKDASAAYCHAAAAGNGAGNDITVTINPDVPRNVSITTTNVAAPSGNVTITGVLAGGGADTEAIAISAGAIAYGVKAWATISKYNIPAGVSASDTVSLGISDKIGLANAFSAEADIYKKHVDGIDESDEISGNGNTTNGTLNCATIVANEDITVWYHN
jgi:hypothetical protein